MKKLGYILLLLISLFSCSDADRVKFEEPQPLNVNIRKSFGFEIQGMYKKFSNPNKTMVIHKDYISTSLKIEIATKRFDLKLDSNIHIDLKNDSAIINYFKKNGIEVKITNDTLYYTMDIKDTIFNISSKNVLKKYKRNYFLNYQFADKYWRVKKLKKRGDTVYFGEITPTDTLLTYDYASIDTNIAKERAREYILSPSKREFKKLMRSKAFTTTEKYIKE